ncbi:MAG: hypothetical protein ACI4S4_00395, partial [Candidatus Ornithospirochaeta sp.]
MGKKKNKSVILRVLGIVLLSLAVLYVLSLFVAGRILHPEFYRAGKMVQKIPGLREDFVPQGVTVTKDGTILVCGYSDSSNPSRIYRLDGKGNSSVVYLENQDGSPYKGHAGGITAASDFVYISNASKIFILRTSDVLSAPDGDTLSFIDSFPVPCRSSFTSSDGEFLYVGEYHAAGYNTDESHRIETEDGNIYEAIVFGYRLDDCGKAEREPVKAYATRDFVQGFASFGVSVALSCSSGLKASSIFIYDTEGQDSTFILDDGRKISLVVLDSRRLVEEIDAPHMSEDLEYRNGKLILVFEAGAKKYGMGFVPSS